MIRISVVCIGKIKEKYMREAVDDYTRRLSKYSKLDFQEFNDINDTNADAVIRKEGDMLLKAINKDENTCVIALDVSGKEMDSLEFASFFFSATVKGISRFVFVIGGSNGIDTRICKSADIRLSISKMTFTHHMCRLILLEQIYRAMKINGNETYHK